ncbi:MAG: MoxR family ATPase [Verrucomicrobia bacterium]|nr:MoxR family ATPase [Verrucomicrobiota bacterium]
MTKSATPPPADDVAAVARLKQAFNIIRDELAKVIVGQDDVIEELLITLFARGHCLLVGVPGLAKTMLVNCLSRVLSLSFKRIQFTPDLMPSDITGTDIIQEDPDTGRRKFVFLPGPVFGNMLLADEINRTPPKTQAALLEAMQEHKVTAGGRTYTLDEPFFVMATQNPIEQEGTYPLPEAQLDRFMFEILIDYPTEAEEMEILKRTTSSYVGELQHVLTGPEIMELQGLVRRVPVADHVYRYAMDLVRATRVTGNAKDGAPDFIKEWLAWGAGPRASQYLILGGKARAILTGRFHVTTEDIQACAAPVLRHRLVTNFNAESQGITTDAIVERLLETIPVAETVKA